MLAGLVGWGFLALLLLGRERRGLTVVRAHCLLPAGRTAWVARLEGLAQESAPAEVRVASFQASLPLFLRC